MPRYFFEAITGSGERIHGQVDADDALAAVQALQSRQGYEVRAVRTEEEQKRIEADIALREDASTSVEEQLASASGATAAPDALTEGDTPTKRRWWHRLRRSKKGADDAPQEAEAPAAIAETPETPEAALAQEARASGELLVTSKHLVRPKKHHRIYTAAKMVHVPASELPPPPAEEERPSEPPAAAERAPASEPAPPESPVPDGATEKPQLSTWDRFLTALFPKHAAKVAAARSAHAAAVSAEAAAEAAKQTAKVVETLAARAKEGADQVDGGPRYSRLFGATILGKGGRKAFEALRLKRGKKAGAAGAAEEGGTEEVEGEGEAEIDVGPDGKRTAKVKSDLSEVDLLGGIRRSGMKGARKSTSEQLSAEALLEERKVDLDLSRIEIQGPGLLGWFRFQVARVRYQVAKRKVERERKLAEKRTAEEAKRKEDAEIRRQKAILKAATKAKKEKEQAEKKGQTQKTIVMGAKKPARSLWQQLQDLFSPKPKKAADTSLSRRLSFQMTEAEQQKEAEKARLLIQGFVPTGNPFVDTWNKLNDFLIQHQKVKLKELVTFYNLLAVMINSGIPLVKSLHQLVDQQKNPRFKRILFQIVYEVENGKSMSRAMREFPDVFSDAHLGMIEAGEASGQLGTVMKRIAEEAEKSQKMLSKVKGALIYPMVIFAILAIVMVIVMVMVVPKMVEVFANAGASLPLPTRILITVSDFLVNYWYVVLVVVGGTTFGFVTYIKTEEGKYYWDYAKLKLPIFGQLFLKVSLARFTSSLSTLSSSGLSIIKALKINADSVGNEIFRQEILATAESVKRGVSIAKDLQGNKLFPAMVVDMIAVGEETAQVATVSQKIAEFYEAEVDDMVKNMQSLMEPFIIVIVGILVGGLVAAIMLPIMNLSEVATKG